MDPAHQLSAYIQYGKLEGDAALPFWSSHLLVF